ncbi:MAG: TOBE-like domain-containing protein, partial [Planctomycetes bacterium]|nr:TOBE-like domain-containing protein [Planctomycetota bacterium]
ANPFVMDFLGNVNVFSGRVQGGKAWFGTSDAPVEFPEYPHAESREATLYIRPHELDIERSVNGAGGLRAEIRRINPTGSLVKVYAVASEYNAPIHVELNPERYGELRLREGESVYIVPKRVRAFWPEYSI